MSKKKGFDRKNAVTFHLVHRSQRDPLITDADAPQHVLVEAASAKQAKSTAENPEEITKRREKQRKYGILYDDDYNYLQHLKRCEDEPVWEYVENPNHTRKQLEHEKRANAMKLNLPSSVFATEFEEDIGMLNKAAPHSGPRPDLDPDIVAALDGDFDKDEDGNVNELEDDFILKAMGTEDVDDCNEVSSDFDTEGDDNDDDDNDEELMDKLGPLMRERFFNDEETKSRFTEYSMSSSVIRRNEQLTLLDDRFDRFYASYDDPELGDLGLETIEGSWHQKHPYVLNCFKQFKKSNEVEKYSKEWDRERIKKYTTVDESNEGDDSNEEMIDCEVNDPKEKKWDCESILTTTSNIYNHPKLIDETTRRRRSNANSAQSTAQLKITIDPKSNLPTNVLRDDDNNKITAKALAALQKNDIDTDDSANKTKDNMCAKSVLSTLSILSIRPKDESVEEKRERKRLLREFRGDRRIEKKANATAFKIENKRQRMVNLNKKNQTGTKIV